MLQSIGSQRVRHDLVTEHLCLGGKGKCSCGEKMEPVENMLSYIHLDNILT